MAFLGVMCIGVVLNTAIVFALTTFIAPFDGITPPILENIAKVIAAGVILFWNFIGFKLIVFKIGPIEDEEKNDIHSVDLS